MIDPPREIRVPGDKSITHRALILASLAEGESRLTGLLDAGDTRSTARLLRELGVAVPDLATAEARVAGGGVHAWTPPRRTLDCGNSGTTVRLLLGALSGCPFEADLDGDASLRRRPMRRVTDPLTAMGASFREVHASATLPIRVTGRRPLTSLEWQSPHASAQVKSALLLAGLTGGAPVTVTEPGASRDHTERLLSAMGGKVSSRSGEAGHGVSLEPGGALSPLDFRIPGDFSAAFFFLAFAAVEGHVRIPGVGLNPLRTGALEVLRRMGAAVETTVESTEAGEPVGSVTVRSAGLRGVTVEAAEVPALLDEVPALAMVAACAEGETRFEGIGELRVKESDRVHAVSENLRRLGVETESGPDHLAVMGAAAFRPASIDAHGDHRIAMAFGVLRALGRAPIRIDDEEVVAISHPDFWRVLETLQEGVAKR
jgi:3-phosphoshikimate 1-carboxyvinyltransferase